MSWTRRTMIVREEYAQTAQAIAAGVPGGAGMWKRRLSATGSEPSTHRISAGLIWPEFSQLLSDAQAVYSQAGGAIPLETIQAMLEASVVRETDNPHAVLSELGLKFIETVDV